MENKENVEYLFFSFLVIYCVNKVLQTRLVLSVILRNK